MTRSRGKSVTAVKPPPAATSTASGAEPQVPRPDAATDVSNPLSRWVVWVWTLAFVALYFQALLDLVFGAIFGPVGR